MDGHGHDIPVIEALGCLLVSLQGDVTDEQIRRLETDVLNKLDASGRAGLVLDVSGVWLMDSHFCATLSRLAKSARLMGTRAILCGMSPGIVMTLLTMGIELGEIETALHLDAALARLGRSAGTGARHETNADVKVGPNGARPEARAHTEGDRP